MALEDLRSSFEAFTDALSPIGIPSDPSDYGTPQGLPTNYPLSQPQVSTSQSWWDTIKQDSSSAVAWVEDEVKNVYGGVKDVTKTVYGDVSSGVGTVYDDVSSRPLALVDKTYWYVIGAVVVLGAVIYYAGKSGGLRVTAVV